MMYFTTHTHTPGPSRRIGFRRVPRGPGRPGRRRRRRPGGSLRTMTDPCPVASPGLVFTFMSQSESARSNSLAAPGQGRLFGFLSNSSTLLVGDNPGQPGVALRQRRAQGRGATAPAVDRRCSRGRSPSRRIWAGHSLARRGSIITGSNLPNQIRGIRTR
jgi:hypothetical protein